MSDRNLDITKFSYKSYRILKKRLGEFDAVVECNEIAIKEFVERAKVAPNGINRYIQELSIKHNVNVDYVDFDKFSSRIRQYYIASVSQQFEQFLFDFKKEFQLYFGDELTWKVRIDNETVLENSLKNVFNGKMLKPSTISNDLTLCYEYYRLIRNFMAHTDRDKKRIEQIHSKIHKNKNVFINELELQSLPNKIYEIDFSDFILFTNIVKHLAFNLSVSAKPNNERITEILFNVVDNESGTFFQGIKKLKNDDVRYSKAIKNHLRTNFGRFSSSDSTEIVNKFKNLLA